jgi:hypothetical protein
MSELNQIMNSFDEYQKAYLNSRKSESDLGNVSVASESYNYTLPTKIRHTIDNLYKNVADFLNENRLGEQDFGPNLVMTGDHEAKIANFSTFADSSVEAGIEELVNSVGIAPKDHDYAVLSVMKILGKFHDQSKNVKGIGHEHYQTPKLSMTVANDMSYSTAMASTLNGIQTAASESFSTMSDYLLPDVKTHIVITLLRLKFGIITNRIFPRRSLKEPWIQFVIENLEGYNMEDSMSLKHDIRNGRHRFWISDLLSDPSPVSMVLKPVVPLVVNDTTSEYLAADGILLPGIRVPLLDLTYDGSRPGYNSADYTDILSDGGRLDTVYFDLVYNSTTTKHLSTGPLSAYDDAKFMPIPNTPEANPGFRLSTLRYKTPLLSTTLDADGVALGGGFVTLGSVAGGYYGVIKIEPVTEIDIREATSEMKVSATIVPYYDETKVDPVGIDYTNFLADLKKFTVKITGYSVDLKFSEENLKKSTIALRSIPAEKIYSVVTGPNYLIDWSLREAAAPADVVNGLTQVMQIGLDDRNLDIITDTINDVYTRARSEYLEGEHLNNRQRISEAYVSGRKVKPTIIKTSFDAITGLKSLRNSDYLSDVRSRSEAWLMQMLTQIIQESKYNMQLDAGEKVHFKVITSLPIFSALFASPLIHQHIEAKYPQGDTPVTAGQAVDGIEYTKELSNGFKVTFVIAPYDKVQDQMIFVINREQHAESELNFGINADYGVFTAQITPTYSNGAFQRLFANSREYPIITTPIAAIVDVTQYQELFDTTPYLP